MKKEKRYWKHVETERKNKLKNLRRIYKKEYSDEEKDRRLTDYAPSNNS